MARRSFDAWIIELDEQVIQGEYGYEPGEFTVYPEHWRGSFRAGLTPHEAFRQALEAHEEQRREEERQRLDNWQRVQDDDAKAIAEYRARKAPDHV